MCCLRPSPDEIQFGLYFEADISKDLEWWISHILLTQSPKVNLTVNDLHLVEVLHLGDLYLIPRDITLDVVPSTLLPMPSTPSDTLSLPTMSVSSTSETVRESSSAVPPTPSRKAGFVISVVVDDGVVDVVVVVVLRLWVTVVIFGNLNTNTQPSV